jgi:molybdopterin-containing oxidoreductase family iron-sulfur binding subunit
LKEEMQVGLNAYALYKGFKCAVTLVKADTDDHEFACVQGQNING